MPQEDSHYWNLLFLQPIYCSRISDRYTFAHPSNHQMSRPTQPASGPPFEAHNSPLSHHQHQVYQCRQCLSSSTTSISTYPRSTSRPCNSGNPSRPRSQLVHLLLCMVTGPGDAPAMEFLKYYHGMSLRVVVCRLVPLLSSTCSIRLSLPPRHFISIPAA